MGMSEIGGESRQTLVHIDIALIPIEKCGYREPVSKVMDAWTGAIPGFSQTYLARYFDESPTDGTVGERCALVGEKKAVRGRSGIEFIAPIEILIEVFQGGRMEGNQT